MSRNRIWIIASFLVIAAMVAGGYFLGISPLLSAAATSTTDRVGVEQQNAGYEVQLETLREEYEGIDTKRDLLREARTAVPDIADDANFVGELHELQASSGASIAGFSVSDVKPYAPVVTELVAEPAEATTEGVSEDTAGTAPAPATTTDTTPAAVSTPLVPGAELINATTFIAVPYTISVTGTLEQTQAYVAGLQKASRLFLVTRLAIVEDESNGGFSADIDGYIWVYRGGTMSGEAATPPANAVVTAN